MKKKDSQHCPFFFEVFDFAQTDTVKMPFEINGVTLSEVEAHENDLEYQNAVDSYGMTKRS